ncbi:universal stress protein [Cryptosporangium arvum]|uniref:Universal stress protein UspA-like protein n=1 Tax=Cryptosporangium arvum DSM 44712 TaxID=927661 RepID=A0A010ZY09_9ACTN|nr:universal stress protein [Cryptosporangium arvum]EXG82102.1 universal stress protein UspA-like protein [Cryptosporangium arvum DSM 44712]
MATKYAHVLVGTDGSEKADRAVRWAAREAVLRGEPLRIVHAFLWPYLRVSTAPVPGLPGTGLRQAAEDLLAAAVTTARGAAPGVDVTTSLPVGAPVGVLRAAAENAELVVVGSDGLGRVAGLIVGSVSTDLVARSRCPLVVVTGHAGERIGEPRVVAGIDGSDHHEVKAVLDFTFREAAWRTASVTVVHATRGRRADSEGDTAVPTAMAAWSDRYPDVAVRYVDDSRSPATALAAQADDADLLVLGTRGRGGLAGLVRGSVGQVLLQHARCPVAVVHGDT